MPNNSHESHRFPSIPHRFPIGLASDMTASSLDLNASSKSWNAFAWLWPCSFISLQHQQQHVTQVSVGVFTAVWFDSFCTGSVWRLLAWWHNAQLTSTDPLRPPKKTVISQHLLVDLPRCECNSQRNVLPSWTKLGMCLLWDAVSWVIYFENIWKRGCLMLPQSKRLVPSGNAYCTVFYLARCFPPALPPDGW